MSDEKIILKLQKQIASLSQENERLKSEFEPTIKWLERTNDFFGPSPKSLAYACRQELERLRSVVTTRQASKEGKL